MPNEEYSSDKGKIHYNYSSQKKNLHIQGPATMPDIAMQCNATLRNGAISGADPFGQVPIYQNRFYLMHSEFVLNYKVLVSII